MRRSLALALVIGAMVVDSRAAAASAPPARLAPRWCSASRWSAPWLAGDVLRRFQLPRVTGYLLFGLVVGPYVGNVITEGLPSASAHHRPRDDAHCAHRRPDDEPRPPWAPAGPHHPTDRRDAGLTLIGLLAVAWMAWPWLPVAPEAAGSAKLAMVAPLVVSSSASRRR